MAALSIGLCTILTAWGCGGGEQGTLDGGGVDASQGSRLERYRPQIHFSPPAGWMNDPNGLFYHDGRYHLFYQYAPEGFLKTMISWGHATSSDMIHWDDLPPAIEPDDMLGNVYSGSAVVDSSNTSGLCDGGPCLVAAFTSSGGESGSQKQSLAFSTPPGATWTQYAQNPVLTPDAGQKDFRDPKVFWHEAGGRWIMALAVKDRVSIYHSPNLREWTHASDFIRDAADRTGTWECPDLFMLPVSGEAGVEKWVMVVSVFSGGPAGGSGVRYFIGGFDGSAFDSETDGSEPLWIDRGSDFYAWQSWSDAPGDRRVGVAWMNNWGYAIGLSTKPWQGAMTLPRELSLVRTAGGCRLVQQPVAELVSLERGVTFRTSGQAVAGRMQLPATAPRQLMRVRLELEPGDAAEAGVSLESSSGKQLVIGYNSTAGKLFVERFAGGLADLPQSFAARHEAPISEENGRVLLEIIIDRSSVELFAGGGSAVITDQFFPGGTGSSMWLYSEGGTATIRNMTITEMGSSWAR
ncbi:MAG: glycoside hydrolase family 32 protein [Myxococcota bacterium]|jgi:fructan beta-fructosidase